MLEKILLKDQFFNKEKVKFLSGLIKVVYSDFDDIKFIKELLIIFPELELKQRITHISKCLKKYLPNDYTKSLQILLDSLPEELDPNKTDADFGDFIFAPLGEFVSTYGCKKEYLEISLNALSEMTKRFSCEDSIRAFVNKFEERTFQKILEWSKSNNYHLRRLSSEGTRPLLPWAKRIDLNYKKTIKILDNLYQDNTRYVTRSVANHLNDISKIDSGLVIDTLKKWKEKIFLAPHPNLPPSRGRNSNDFNFIIKHSLRTLIKSGDIQALELLGFGANPQIKIDNFKIKEINVKIGESLEFEFDIKSKSQINQNLIIDYNIHFLKANGKLSPKTYKISKQVLKAGTSLKISKKHPLRKMTTLKLYSGIHLIKLQINGTIFGKEKFKFLFI